MKRNKFSAQKTSPEQEVPEPLITKHHANDNRGQQEAASAISEPSIINSVGVFSRGQIDPVALNWCFFEIFDVT